MDSRRDNMPFWNRYAKFNDLEISRNNRSAYAEMYRLISDTLSKEYVGAGNRHRHGPDCASYCGRCPICGGN